MQPRTAKTLGPVADPVGYAFGGSWYAGPGRRNPQSTHTYVPLLASSRLAEQGVEVSTDAAPFFHDRRDEAMALGSYGGGRGAVG